MNLVKIAADYGVKDAQLHYAKILDQGKFTKKNLQLAATYYKSSANAGELSSQRRLAELYAGVDGFNKDLELSFYWLLKVAQQGDAEASYQIAEAYLSGQGVEVDRKVGGVPESNMKEFLEKNI